MKAGRLVRTLAAGFCGSLAHLGLMTLKHATGMLPGFQPYDDLQRLLSGLLGTHVPAPVLWVLSFLNGAAVLGTLFARVYRSLPGRNGAVKGIAFGIASWIAMGLLFFPLLGQGPFGLSLELGIAPAVFSLAMLLAYSLTLGIAYAVLVEGR